MCPTVSKGQVHSKLITKFGGIRSCPKGPELMRDVTLSTAFVGPPPYIIRQPNNKIKGSLYDAMVALSRRFRFNFTSVPARGFDNLVKNVRSCMKAQTLFHDNKLTDGVSFVRFRGGMLM